jgi:uncharacterized protein (DUF488 family)
MRLYHRQKLLLSLVEAAGGELPATDLQKLLFLYTRHCEKDASFQFVPYRFGCFSFQSYADRNMLVKKGMLHEDEAKNWKVTNLAKSYSNPDQVKLLKHFMTNIASERGRDLVRRVYKEEPFYATRSEIIDQVFPDPSERKKLLSSVKFATNRALFTIGYEGDSIDGYLNRLIANNVKLLVDVRRNPLSRKTGFSKRHLAIYCNRVGIEYLHMPQLGIPSHRRRELNTQADYDALFVEYEKEDLPQQRPAISELLVLLKKHNRIALTCFELESHCCHRHCVSEAMEANDDCPVAQHI